MKKLVNVISAIVLVVVITLLSSVETTANVIYEALESNIAYVDDEGSIWFKEFQSSYYSTDYIKWSVAGKSLIVQGDFSETYYYDEYEEDEYFRLRMYDDADDYTDGVDWLIYQHFKYSGYAPYAKLDMSKYADGKYVLYYDVDCCTYEVCYMLITNGEIYIQPWDRDYKKEHVEKYDKLMQKLYEIDTTSVVDDFNNSEYYEFYYNYLGENMYNKAHELTNGIKSNYEKARAVYDYVTRNTLVRGETESNRLYGAMLNYIGIPSVYINPVNSTYQTAMSASYIDGSWIINTVPAPHTNQTTYVNVIAGGFDKTAIGILDEMLIEKVDLEVDDFIYVGYMKVGDGELYLRPGETKHMSLYIEEERMQNEEVKWWSSNEEVAVVDHNGNVTGISEGYASIYVEVDGITDCEFVNVEEYPGVTIRYNTHIQGYGWECDDISDCYSCYNICPENGEISGTVGEGKRLEGIKIEVFSDEAYNDVDLGVRYTTHCQGYGWLPWSSNGDMSGTQGESKRLEAIMIELTGEDAKEYDVYYRVHAQSYGWLAWARNGAPAGTSGYGKRLEAIQIVVVKKGGNVPNNYKGVTSDCDYEYVTTINPSPVVNHESTDPLWPEIPGKETPNVAYRTHVQTYGWQGWKYNGQMSGTEGESKRLEGIEIDITNQECYGDIIYTTHVQSYGWQGDLNDKSTWSYNGEMSGTWGESKRLEAICIDLTDEMAEKYDVYYRVHAQSYGWLGWAKNGEAAGTAGCSKRLEGIQIVLVEKGDKAPDMGSGGIVSDNSEAYIEK